jgi:hypothetical protein
MISMSLSLLVVESVGEFGSLVVVIMVGVVVVIGLIDVACDRLIVEVVTFLRLNGTLLLLWLDLMMKRV